MNLYVIEARSDHGKVIARCEFDNRKRIGAWMPWLKSWLLVHNIRVFKDDVEQPDLNWERPT